MSRALPSPHGASVTAMSASCSLQPGVAGLEGPNPQMRLRCNGVRP